MSVLPVSEQLSTMPIASAVAPVTPSSNKKKRQFESISEVNFERLRFQKTRVIEATKMKLETINALRSAVVAKIKEADAALKQLDNQINAAGLCEELAADCNKLVDELFVVPDIPSSTARRNSQRLHFEYCSGTLEKALESAKTASQKKDIGNLIKFREKDASNTNKVFTARNEKAAAQRYLESSTPIDTTPDEAIFELYDQIPHLNRTLSGSFYRLKSQQGQLSLAQRSLNLSTRPVKKTF
jgi:hypothetical protein